MTKDELLDYSREHVSYELSMFYERPRASSTTRMSRILDLHLPDIPCAEILTVCSPIRKRKPSSW